MIHQISIGGLPFCLPIIQGGMGVGVSLSGLAVAVANQGGVGVISCAGLGLLYRSSSKNFLEASIQGLKEELRKAKEKTIGIIGVNIMVAMTNYEDMVKTAIAEKADIIFSGGGLPLDLPKYIQPGNHTRLVPIVSSAKATRLLCERWSKRYNYLPDAVVVEGPLAGGHLGFKKDQITDPSYSLEKLVPEVVQTLEMYEKSSGKDIPVIAAGGIYSGADMFNIMAKGAKAVQLGTRFVTTTECNASDEFKQAYIDSKFEDINIIQSPVGMPGRAIDNAFLEKVKLGLKMPISCPYKCISTCDIANSPYCIIAALYSAYKGNMEKGYAFAGTNAWRATKISTVPQVFSELLSEYKQAELACKN